MNLDRLVLYTWAELAWAEFSVGRVGMCRVGFWAVLSVIRLVLPFTATIRSLFKK